MRKKGKGPPGKVRNRNSPLILPEKKRQLPIHSCIYLPDCGKEEVLTPSYFFPSRRREIFLHLHPAISSLSLKGKERKPLLHPSFFLLLSPGNFLFYVSSLKLSDWGRKKEGGKELSPLPPGSRVVPIYSSSPGEEGKGRAFFSLSSCRTLILAPGIITSEEKKALLSPLLAAIPFPVLEGG